MRKLYIKEEKTSDSEENTYTNLIKDLNVIKNNLECDYKNLQCVSDEKLLDYYTYKIKSDESKYDFLIKELKKL